MLKRPNMSLCWLFALIPLVKPTSAHSQVTLKESLASPMAVEAIALGPNEIRVYWNPVRGASSYSILRDGVEIGRAESDKSFYSDQTVKSGQTYGYSVTVTWNPGALPSPGSQDYFTILKSRPYLERNFDLLPNDTECDVLVVGATTAGVAAAVTASKYGMNVVLIEETRRLGGMPVNGLGATDMRRPEHSSGFFEEFRRRVQSIYGKADGMSYEPRVAHQAMKEIVWTCPNLVVHRQVRPVRVIKRGERIVAVQAEELPSGKKVWFHPKLIIDATECGDVAAWGGAPFRVGREPRSKREPHAGHIYYDRAGDKPLPGSTGEGDKRVQSYAYLMTVRDYGPGADKTIPKPPGFDPSKYSHATKWEQSWAVSSGKLPNGKFEVNQHPHGSDLQGVNYKYPTATYAERRRIEQIYRDHDLGYLYYIQTVEGHKNIGLSDDDYRDTDNWPPLLYIREARRFESDVVLDETDIRDSRSVARPDAVGLGDYPMDSHAVQPKANWSTPDLGEGEFYLPSYSPWHQVPYRAMIPKRLENVFVPTAVSATHVAYGTLRLEPVRMHFGEAAGIAAYLCLHYNYTPRSVPVRQIQSELLKNRAAGPGERAADGIGGPGPNAHPGYLYMFPDVKPGDRYFEAIQWLAARGFYPCPEPKERTVSSGQVAAPFRPGDPIKGGEAMGLLESLQLRSGGLIDLQRVDPKLLGDAWKYLAQDTTMPISRHKVGELLIRLMGWRQQNPSGAHYADIEPNAEIRGIAEALYENWIDSRLWDGLKAYAPDGKLYFRPYEPVTRGQFAELLYLAHMHIGPLFEDHPRDLQPIPVLIR